MEYGLYLEFEENSFEAEIRLYVLDTIQTEIELAILRILQRCFWMPNSKQLGPNTMDIIYAQALIMRNTSYELTRIGRTGCASLVSGRHSSGRIDRLF